MEAKTIVILLGIIMMITGVILMVITEEAGQPGAEVTPFAEASEDIHPYFWHGLVIVLIGIITVVLAAVKMV